jgi:hypothetical protein
MRPFLLTALAAISFVTVMTVEIREANAVVCAEGVYRAGCVSGVGRVGVGRAAYGRAGVGRVGVGRVGVSRVGVGRAGVGRAGFRR